MSAAALFFLTSLMATTPRVEIRGNVVLPAKLYLDVLKNKAQLNDRNTDKQTAYHLARTLQRFLRRMGYQVARVRGRVQDKRVVLIVDEGRLARVLFIGQGDVSTAQLRFDVEIPYQVFNRTLIERQLRRLRENYRFTDIELRLVRTENVEHAGPQLDEFEALPGVDILSADGRYDLHVILGQRDWSVGLGIHVDIKPPDGFKLGASYSGRALLLSGDRWRARADAAINEYRTIMTTGTPGRPSADNRPPLGGTNADLSRATVELTWATPAWLGLRPALNLFGDLMTRTRPEFGLEISIYRLAELGALVGIDWDITDGFLLSLSGGVSSRWLFDVNQPTVGAGVQDPGTPTVTPWRIQAGLLSLRTRLVFDPENLRIDKRHELKAEVRAYFGSEREPRVMSRGEYQKFIELGWHDLLIRFNGLAHGGLVRFTDEESLGTFTRAVFGWRHWVRYAGSFNPEFRFSVVRDLLKIGAFVDAAVFESRNPATPGDAIKVAVGMGPGIHLLLFNAFQADFFYSFGIDSDGSFEHAFSGSMRKAF